MKKYDAIVIGGGFYGAAVAIYLKNQRSFKHIALIERENDLLLRASYNNQARVHNGYHYPRNITTASRSRINFSRFVQDWPETIKKDFTKLYAIGKHNSKIATKQFERFCNEIGAKLEPAPAEIQKLFEPNLIEAVYLVEEYAFNANALAESMRKNLAESGIEIHLKKNVKNIFFTETKRLAVESHSAFSANSETMQGHYVFNCTYSGINQLTGDFPGIKTPLKHEIAEIALMSVPSLLQNLGITVMDGPFFSLMPFPAKNLHALTHVRYTPHCQWLDTPTTNPYLKLDNYSRSSRNDRMVRDATRYIPVMSQAKHLESLFEIKTILLMNEEDDGRPILFEKHRKLPGCYSILGGKIDNIYDVLEKLDAESFSLVDGGKK